MKSIFTIIAIVLLGGGLIGESGHVLASSPAPSVSDNRSTKELYVAFNSPASDLRLQMNNLMHEHAAMGALTLTALYKGADTAGLMQQMTANENQIGNLIQTAYGTEKRNTFTQLWTQHMDEYQNYTLAKKNKDTAKMNTARQHLYTIAINLGILLASSNQNQSVSATEIRNAMMDHINGTLAIVDVVSQGNASQSASLTKAGYEQSGSLADVITKAMLIQNPNAF